MIRADHLSQGQINGFPVYRLKWAKLGSVHRRFKGCVRDIRAETYKPRQRTSSRRSELYVASRGNGLSSKGRRPQLNETPPGACPGGVFLNRKHSRYRM